eukprot:s3237_g4.t1
MRSNLLQALGEDDSSPSTQAVAVQYYRQVLQRKASGPVARELLSLCAPAHALDLIIQRIKSTESTLAGTHWTVSQKLELLPAEQASLTATAEMREAQRVALEESKARYLSSLPDGRPLQGRLEEERGSDRRQSQLKGREAGDETGEAAPEKRQDAGDCSATEEERSGTGTVFPEKAAKEGDQKEDSFYQEGTALALQTMLELKPSAPDSWATDFHYEAGAQPTFLSEPKGSLMGPIAADEKSGSDRLVAKKCMGQSDWGGQQLVSCGPLLLFELLEVLPLRSQDTGNRDTSAIFPLPTSRSVLTKVAPELDECGLCWLLCVVLGLNSFWGDLLFNDHPVNEGQATCLVELVKDVKRFARMDAVIPHTSWQDLFSVRSIDYKGDEVKVAQWFSWANVEPAQRSGECAAGGSMYLGL